MALTNFRESNQVKWVGVRPGHRGEEVAVKGFVRDGTDGFYIVGVGKIFFWTDFVCTIADTGGGNDGVVAVRDVGDDDVYRVVDLTMAIAGQIGFCHTFKVPLEIPTGYDIYIRSGAVALGITLWIHGWLEKA